MVTAASLMSDFLCICCVPGLFKIRPDKKTEPKDMIVKQLGMIAGGTGMLL